MCVKVHSWAHLSMFQTRSKRPFIVMILAVTVLCIILKKFSPLHQTVSVSVFQQVPSPTSKVPSGTEHTVSVEDEREYSLKELAIVLEKKLSMYTNEKSILSTKTCDKIKSGGKPCLNTTCPAKFSPVPAERLREILATRNHSLQPYRAVMREATKGISIFKYVLVSAVSTNHFKEMQALVKNLHQNLFPRLSNFTFVLFDLGLTASERKLTEKNCKCTVLDYPFDKLPPSFSLLKCYTWKPNIIRSLINKAEFLVWMDSSVRWSSDAPLEKIFGRSKERGIQLGFSRSGCVGVRTDHNTFLFYGDQACQYLPYGEPWATYGVYHNEPFVRQAILDPWLSCAFSSQCMCVDDFRSKMGCHEKLPRRTELCHRFDQSSLGIIVSKLYTDRTVIVRLHNMGISMARGQIADWFTY